MNDILLDSSGHLKLSGFKHSQALPQRYEPMLVGSCGDERYIAPEMLRGQGYGQTVDWWAYGVVAYIMLVGRFPFNRSRECSLTDDILTTELEVTKESIMIEDMDIIATVLASNLASRQKSRDTTWLRDRQRR